MPTFQQVASNWSSASSQSLMQRSLHRFQSMLVPTMYMRGVRLKFRYLDIRRERMQKNLRIRAKVNSAIRGAMEVQNFVEVETPF